MAERGVWVVLEKGLDEACRGLVGRPLLKILAPLPPFGYSLLSSILMISLQANFLECFELIKPSTLKVFNKQNCQHFKSLCVNKVTPTLPELLMISLENIDAEWKC